MTNKTKKVAITSAVIGTAIAASILGVSVFKSKDKPTALPQEIDSGKLAEIEEILEYGEDITGKTITVNAKTRKLEVDFNKLNPEVDTMKVGITEHTLDVEKEKFDVNVKVQDTKFPVFKDFKDEYSLKGKLSEEQIKAELAKLIKAEDPVDGEVNVEFELINDGVKKLKVKVKATDLNGNVTKDETIVSLENKVVKEGKKEEESKKDESKDESAAGSKDESKNNVTVAKPSENKPSENKKPVANNRAQNNKQQGASNTQSQPKPQPKPEAKPQPKPQPKPEAKPQPKPQPKPEVKPQPKPEVKPQPKPDTSTSKWPVPSGATVFMKTENDIGYNYSKTISSNVTITKVTQDFLENAIIIGTKGSHGIVTFFYKPNGSYGYYMDSNVFTSEEVKALINVAKLFLP